MEDNARRFINIQKIKKNRREKEERKQRGRYVDKLIKSFLN